MALSLIAGHILCLCIFEVLNLARFIFHVQDIFFNIEDIFFQADVLIVLGVPDDFLILAFDLILRELLQGLRLLGIIGVDVCLDF